MESNRNKDNITTYARFGEYCGDVTGDKSKRSFKYCPISASKEARKTIFDKRRSKRIAAMTEEDSHEQESKSIAVSEKEGAQHARQPKSETKKEQQLCCRAQFIHMVKLLLICKKVVYALPPELVKPNVDKLRVAVSNAVYVAEKIPFITLLAMAVMQNLTRRAAKVATLVHIPDSSRSTETRSYYHCLLRLRRLLKMTVQATDLVHSQIHYLNPPEYWEKSLNIPFFLKPATLVYKSSFPKDVMMKALKEYSAPASTQDEQKVAEMSTGKVSSSTEINEDLGNQPNSDLKPQKSAASDPTFKIPSSESLSKKRSTSKLPKAQLVHKHSNKTGQFPATSPLLTSLRAPSTPNRETGAKLAVPSNQSNGPLSQVSELPMCATSPQENAQCPPDVQSLQPVAENLSVSNKNEEKPVRARIGHQKQSSMAYHAALSKEARKASFDKHRSLSIAATLSEKKVYSSAKGSESELDESSDSSDNEDNSTDDEYDDSSDEKLDEKEREEEQQKLEKNKKLRQQTSAFLLQLNKCLNTCKKEVYTLSPNLVKPNVIKLREAVDNALYVAERIKRISVSSTSSLKQLTQSAATVARLVHIPDSMHNTATKSSYHCLLRIRRFLNLAIRVAAVLHAYTEKIDFKSISRGKVKMTLSDFAREADGGMEVAKLSKQPKVENAIILSASSAFWKPSSRVPFFLKPATLVYSSSSHKEVLLNSLKKKLECLPPLQTQNVQMVNPTTVKECNFDEACKDLHNTLTSDQKQLELIVSVPLYNYKLPHLKKGDKKLPTTSVLPELCLPPAKRRANDACRQFVLDDIVDVGVVQGSKASIPSRGPDYNSGVGEMINDFLWKVRREVVDKQRRGAMASSSVLKRVKNRFSPYAGRSSSAKFSPCQNKQSKCAPSKILSCVPEPQRKTDLKLSIASSQSERIKSSLNKALRKRETQKPCTNLPHSKAAKYSFSKPIDKTGSAAVLQSTQQRKQSWISMDQLAGLVESKCYPITITESLSKRYSRLSFKDPCQYELTSSVIPREQYPGLILQDGGVKFVLRASPLTPVLLQRRMEGRDLNILPSNLQKSSNTIVPSDPKIPQVVAASTFTSIHKGKWQCDPNIHKGGSAMTLRPSTPVYNMPSLNSVIKNTIDAVTKKPAARAPLRPTRRRLHPNLSNELAARKNPRLESNPIADREEYKGILGTKVEVNRVSETEGQSQRVRLGKRNATDAGLPIPAGK